MAHLIDITEIQRILSTDVATVLRFTRDGTMPRPLAIGEALVRWQATEISEWLTEGCPESVPPSSADFVQIRDNLICERIGKGDDPAEIDADHVEPNSLPTFYVDD